MPTPDIQDTKKKSVGPFQYISLVASTEDLFYKTIAFYEDWGLEPIYTWEWRNQKGVRKTEVCFDSEKETWLCAGVTPSGPALTIKVRLVPSDTPESATSDAASEPKVDDNEWRGNKLSIVYQIDDPAVIIKEMKEKGLKFQAVPHEKEPLEVYTHDPLGTLMGFTSKKSTVTDTLLSKPLSTEATAKEAHKQTVDGTKKKRIGVMTSGGDAPGMNGAVRAVVRMSIHLGCESYAIYEGYEGLVQGGKLIKRMEWEDVRGWLSEGGTLIGTARCKAFQERAGRLKSAKNLILNGIDALIVCGGDGSLTGADIFRSEWPGLLQELVEKGELKTEQIEPYKVLNIVGLVGSIDNDMSSTDATIGAYSSLTRICQAVDFIDATALSHSRAFVVEVMGRHCGWLALMAGVSTGADFIFIPETPPGKDWEQTMCDQIAKHRQLGKRKTIVIVAEGAIDRQGKPIPSEYVSQILKEKLGLDTRITTLGHVQRGGSACAYDRTLSTMQGAEAVRAVLDATPDTESPVISIVENQIIRKPLMEAVRLTQSVATAIKAKDFDRAMALRDAEFEEYYRAFHATSVTDDQSLYVPEDKRLRIAIVHVGAPAGGMNAATRAAAMYCMSRGHRCFAIHNGFPGLVRHNSVKELDWLTVEGWAIRGGSEIGTNRTEPNVDFGMVSWYFQMYKFDGLMLVGGFEAYKSLSELREQRKTYPAFRIPMVCLPATISNNVPGTEFSIGSDTCLNALIDYCDAIKQSASASRRRVFVVEVQGGRSGYVATMAGLATGAVAVYTPEDGIKLDQLATDIAQLKRSFANDQGMNRAGKLILRNEKSSKTYTTDMIANMIAEEAGGRFESRTSIPGHVQQGGTPSPMDRVRAVRLAVRCMQFIEERAGPRDEVAAKRESYCVIGIKGAAVVLTPMHELERDDTDWEKRVPKNKFWLNVTPLLKILSGPQPS